MQISTKNILFPFRSNKHLSSDITITNKSDNTLVFKFKASTASRFIIKPSSGSIQSNNSVNIQIIIHRQIVENCENEKLQLLYGPTLQQAESQMFRLGIGEPQKQDKINLTMMVQDKSNRVKNLQKDLENYGQMPISKNQINSKGIGFGLKVIIFLLLGIIIGFSAPIKIFKKKIKN